MTDSPATFAMKFFQNIHVESDVTVRYFDGFN